MNVKYPMLLRLIPIAMLVMLVVILIRLYLGLQAAPSSMPDHRIGVRVVNGIGEFYDRKTNQEFVPRGNNYIRLSQQVQNGQTALYHSTFDPGSYDHNRYALALSQMHQQGYNVVRVFLNHASMGTPDGGLSQPYLANLADFLGLAAQNEVYVILTQDWLPGGKYGDQLNEECCTLFDSANLLRLSRSGAKAFRLFYTDFLSALDALNARTDVIFSYELSNEHFLDNDRPPLSLSSGSVIAVNFKIYDMSSPAAKDKMIAEGMPYWINSIRGAILYLDPTALVSVGFASPHRPGPGDQDQRLSVSAPAIWHSMADFIDLHTYKLPADASDPAQVMKQEMEEFGMIGMLEKPIVMGEFGAEHLLGSANTAALHLTAWQVESCQFGFDGWLLWTWDLTQSEDPNNKYFTAQAGQGAIGSALAPANRPDPCSWE
jgi:hypothetical protein